jgi:peptidoglycan/LPS O-acetylase OafA/YrhL
MLFSPQPSKSKLNGFFLKYRSEIDGLRALAVVPVILFHAGFELFKGGFVGVDVFFVISGYLITTIIIDDIEKNRFSIVNFYERRARRILPALFFVMLACIPFAWMWMLPTQMKDFSQSLVAVSTFLSNVLFWHESGYFDAITAEKPLLHTWSLAVEEQYYVLFPIFLLLAWRLGKSKLFWMIVVFAALSLALSELAWRIDATANFYLAPTRAWELLAGSIAAFIVKKHGVRANNTLSFLGLGLIIFSIFAYDKTTPFPSVYTLIPVAGVMLLIIFANKQTIAAKLLSMKAFVGIGLISYSAYLWHQPLFAFARLRFLDQPSIFFMSALSLATFALAICSWKFIEQPARNPRLFSRGALFLSSVFFASTFILFGIAGHVSQGFNKRLASETLPNDFFSYTYLDRPINSDENSNLCINSLGGQCNLYSSGQSLRRILLVGDSHSVDFQRSFIEFAQTNDYIADQFSIAGCGFLETSEESLFNACATARERLLVVLKEFNYDHVIFVTALYSHAKKISSDAQWASYENFIAEIALRTQHLWLFLPRYTLTSKNPIRNIIYGHPEKNSILKTGYEEVVDRLYFKLNLTKNIDVFNQPNELLKLGGGSDFNALTDNGYPLYRDSNHLTRYGASKIFDRFSFKALSE